MRLIETRKRSKFYDIGILLIMHCYFTNCGLVTPYSIGHLDEHWFTVWLVAWRHHGPLARYVKLRIAHAPGMPGTFSLPTRVCDPDVHHGTCVTHVPWCMPGSLTSGFLWSRWRGKRSRHSRRMRNPQFYVSGKRPMSLPEPMSTYQ